MFRSLIKLGLTFLFLWIRLTTAREDPKEGRDAATDQAPTCRLVAPLFLRLLTLSTVLIFAGISWLSWHSKLEMMLAIDWVRHLSAMILILTILPSLLE